MEIKYKLSKLVSNEPIELTINKLDEDLRQLLLKLTLFKSPFPISAPVEIFGVNNNNIVELYKRNLLTRIELDEEHGKMENPTYWLYNFHPATRSYLENSLQSSSIHPNLEQEYGEKFSEYYYNLLFGTHKAKINLIYDFLLSA